MAMPWFFQRVLRKAVIGAGSIVVEEDYTIYFTPDTPEDLKHRFVREYAEYHAQKMEERRQGIYIDY